MARHNSLINGEWVAASSCTPNINPSNLNDFVGEYAQAAMAQREAAVGAAYTNAGSLYLG